MRLFLAGVISIVARNQPPAFVLTMGTGRGGPSAAAAVSFFSKVARTQTDRGRFLAPVEPGNLLLMGYKDEVPIMSAPGCFRSLKPNVIDLMLPPLIARYRVSTWEVSCLGHGGLLN